MHAPTDADAAASVLLGVAGSPSVVAGSLSPDMFAAAFAALGMRAWYVPLGIRERSAAKALRSLPRLGFAGVNVTMPYKRVAAQVAATRSELVEQTGVANTLVIDSAGQIHAEATDGRAVVSAIASAGIEVQGATVTIVGAGGAATEAAFGCAAAGAGRIRIWNRTLERAQQLVAVVAPAFPEVPLEVLRQLPIDDPAHVFVSAVPESALPASVPRSIHAGPRLVVDFAYRADRRPTALIESATNRGVPAVDGRDLLVRQAAEAFRIWFGTDPPVEEMARAVA